MLMKANYAKHIFVIVLDLTTHICIEQGEFHLEIHKRHQMNDTLLHG
uniref:Uncharacterized protein n=1 Tax=Anguilla anguilla TaxID=7936 RepID=A0A0E9WTB0_ANGAN